MTDELFNCHVCQEPLDPAKKCRSCTKYFCSKHASDFDIQFCSVCVNFSNTILAAKPLVDPDGVTHKGRQFTLTGESWMRSRDLISKMTDVELESKLVALKEAVHEAELVLDYRRIIHGQAENEKSTRFSKKLQRLRLISAVDGVHKAAVGEGKKVNGTKQPSEAVVNATDALKALKKMGLNKDAIANVLLKLAQTKKTEVK
jgi:hypothetical protein